MTPDIELARRVGYIAGTLAQRYPDASIETKPDANGKIVLFRLGYRDRPGATTVPVSAEMIRDIVSVDIVVDLLARLCA